ncbi:MAG: hypothetical protein HQK98_07705 [Nitrospirae bacterium]|nr:hypothetical protein [Nitrospirota bacterium]
MDKLDKVSKILAISQPIIALLGLILIRQFKLSDSIGIVLEAVWTLVVIFVVYYRNINIAPEVRNKVYYISAILLLITALLYYGRFNIFPDPYVKIESPTSDAIVPATVIVSGIAKNIKNGSKLCLINFYIKDGKYYPQMQVLPNQGGKWTGKVDLVYGNEKYQIWAAVVPVSMLCQDAVLKDLGNDPPKYFDQVYVSRL